MADEPADLTLQLLRDARVVLGEHTHKLDAMAGQLSGLDRKIDDLELGVNQAVGLASRALVRSAQARDDAKLLATRPNEIDKRLEALETR